MAVLRYAALAVVVALLTATPAAAAGIGDGAPDFTLPDRDGRTVALADARGRIAIVDFWASWCMACAPLLPGLDELARRYGGRVEVFAVDIDQSRGKADAFLAKHLPSPSPFVHVLEDPSADVLARYGAAGMPALFIVDRHGVVRFVAAGYSPEHVRAIDETLRGLLPADPATAELAR